MDDTHRGRDVRACQICGHRAGNRLFKAREMMFGFRDEFTYMECARCSCLQILDPPADLSRYYPQDAYYSLQDAAPLPRWKAYLLSKKTAYHLGETSLLGWLVSALRPTVHPYVEWVTEVGVDRSARILDVGAGTGQLLLLMRAAGFSDLLGIDPFIPHDIRYSNGVRVLKRTLQGISETFDFVMLHHVFEHVPDPRETLAEINRVLPGGGNALLRMPMADSHAWRTYGSDWVQLDAPRHFFLHTERSLRILAEDAGFEVAKVARDSTGAQFWGSEQYRQDVPLKDERSAGTPGGTTIFSETELAEFEVEARRLNGIGEGDQAAVYLRKIL